LQLVEHSFHFNRFRLWRRDDPVTPIQKLEVRQLTRAMWTVLRYAKNVHPIALVSGQALRTTRALERRGFLFVTSDEKVCITEAGHEALQTMGK
jgi:hypothetical protein